MGSLYIYIYLDIVAKERAFPVVDPHQKTDRLKVERSLSMVVQYIIGVGFST